VSEIEEQDIKVDELTPQSRNVNITIKVISLNPIRDVTSRRDGSSHRVTEALVGDETGAVLLTLWDDTIDDVSEDTVYDVQNGYVNLFRGSMRLNTGRYGSLSPSEDIIEEVNEENNLSDRQFERQRRSYYGGYGRRQRYPRRYDRGRRY
jgi:replication factor A1